MWYYIFVFVLLLYIILHFLNYISAMKAEGIIAGELARAHEFTYQVSVQGKQNYSDERFIIGAGGVIDDEFVLSAAHVFLDNSGDLDEYTFGILLDSIDLMNGNGIYVEVDVIYIPYFSNISKLQDLAVLKLKNKLNLESNPHVTKLNLPKATERFENVWTVIAGYGWNNILVINDENTGVLINITGSTDGLLRFTRMKILKHEVCITDYSFLNPYTHVCSITEGPTGACQGDSGTPIVAESTIIGILSQSPLDCMNDKLPSISTRVTGYINFIELIMNGYQFPGTKIYRNRPHIMEPRRKKTKINNKADDINNRN